MQRDVAAAAAADASMSATKASSVLMDVTTSIDKEMQNTHHRIKQFQVSTSHVTRDRFSKTTDAQAQNEDCTTI